MLHWAIMEKLDLSRSTEKGCASADLAHRCLLFFWVKLNMLFRINMFLWLEFILYFSTQQAIILACVLDLEN